MSHILPRSLSRMPTNFFINIFEFENLPRLFLITISLENPVEEYKNWNSRRRVFLYYWHYLYTNYYHYDVIFIILQERVSCSSTEDPLVDSKEDREQVIIDSLMIDFRKYHFSSRLTTSPLGLRWWKSSVRWSTNCGLSRKNWRIRRAH